MAPPPESITVQIDLAPLIIGETRGGEPYTFADHVAERAATRLLDGEARGSYTGALRSRIESIRDEEIRDAVRPLIAEALENAVNPPGLDRDDEPVTLADRVRNEATKHLARRTDSSRPRASRTVLEEIIEECVRRELTTELKAAVAEARETVVSATKEAAAEIISETIARMAEGRR